MLLVYSVGKGEIEVCRSRVKEKWGMWSWDIERARALHMLLVYSVGMGEIEVCRSRVKER